jgi:hypothetical protein
MRAVKNGGDMSTPATSSPPMIVMGRALRMDDLRSGRKAVVGKRDNRPRHPLTSPER